MSEERPHTPKLPATWPKDRISDDHTVEDRIHNAVLAERQRCERIAEALMEGHGPWGRATLELAANRIRSGQ